jgi:pimeloyl-ACP methyl ester carboxylesterase
MHLFSSPLRLATLIGCVLAGALVTLVPLAPASAASAKPTIVLVHGAFADSSSWDGVIARLQKDGYTVIAAANHLRSVKGDADSVARVVRSVPGPVVLVGHSYGGAVISAAGTGNASVKALVYVAAFAPDVGESAATLSGKYPGSTLGGALAKPVDLGNGTNDLYIEQAKFHQQFAADVPADEARLMAAGQRPITDAALNEAAPAAPAWKAVPSWFVYGKADKNIPAEASAFMAKRANAKKTVAIDGASHVVMTSHPAEVAALIAEAARTAP